MMRVKSLILSWNVYQPRNSLAHIGYYIQQVKTDDFQLQVNNLIKYMEKLKAWAVVNTIKGKFANYCGISQHKAYAIFTRKIDALEYKKDFLPEDINIKIKKIIIVL